MKFNREKYFTTFNIFCISFACLMFYFYVEYKYGLLLRYGCTLPVVFEYYFPYISNRYHIVYDVVSFAIPLLNCALFARLIQKFALPNYRGGTFFRYFTISFILITISIHIYVFTKLFDISDYYIGLVYPDNVTEHFLHE